MMNTSLFCQLNTQLDQLHGKLLCYQGPRQAYYGKTGRLLKQFDENCCAPTQEVRYTFEGTDFFWMMTGTELWEEWRYFLPVEPVSPSSCPVSE